MADSFTNNLHPEDLQVTIGLCWGKCFADGNDNILSEATRIDAANLRKIAVIIDGNDLQYGSEYCEKHLQTVLRYADVFSVVPEYSYKEADEKPSPQYGSVDRFRD